MPFYFPPINASKNEHVKDYILDCLSDGSQKTLKEIYQLVNKKQTVRTSYQSVHQSVAFLVEKNVLVRSASHYTINSDWLNSLDDFISTVKGRKKKRGGHIVGAKFANEGDLVSTYIFETYEAAENYRKKLQFEYFSKKEPRPPYCGHSLHLKSPILYSEKTLKSIEQVKQHQLPCYLLVNGDTPWDEFCARFYRNSLINIKTGIRTPAFCDTMVIGDTITQLYPSTKISQKLDLMLKQFKTIQNAKVADLYENIMQLKSPTKLVVTKNAEIAEQLRQQIMASFKENVFIFDLDGVIYSGFLANDFAQFLCEKEQFSPSNLDSILSLTKKYHDGKISYKKMAFLLLNQYANALKNRKASTIQQLANEFIHGSQINFFPYAKELIEVAHRHGKTVMISGSPQEVVTALKTILPLDEQYGTNFETKNGVYTGKVKRNLALAEKKKELLENWFCENALLVQHSFGFGDTLQDIPILEKVDYAFACNPVKDLEKYARQKKWKTIFRNQNPIPIVCSTIEKSN